MNGGCKSRYIFVTSDESDGRTNGRSYTLTTEHSDTTFQRHFISAAVDVRDTPEP